MTAVERYCPVCNGLLIISQRRFGTISESEAQFARRKYDKNHCCLVAVVRRRKAKLMAAVLK